MANEIGVKQPAALWTIGHSNRPIGEFLALLDEAEIGRLVDVRAYPVSRRHPQFARAALERSLAAAGVAYAWEGRALGGRREPGPGSPHLALANPQFRAYADHMMTAPFQEALLRVIETGRRERTAIMCAERLPAECHRSFIADALVARGVAVSHIVAAAAAQPHALNPSARRSGDALVYDGGAQLRLEG